MNVWPLKFRDLDEKTILFSDDAGGFFKSDAGFLHRYAEGSLTRSDEAFLRQGGHTFETAGDLSWTSFAYRWSRRQSHRPNLSYVILVPTLRCNLTCSYCQVSRAPENAEGFDWTDDVTDSVLQFLAGIESSDIKIEFQGGEPLLRLDLLNKVRGFCRSRFVDAQFVVCTNLQNVGYREWEFLQATDTFISTSLDGDTTTHQRQRTNGVVETSTFFANLETAVSRFGSGKISALPTIDVDRPPDFATLIDNFERFGIRSIYLRPINHQGFARKLKHKPGVLNRWNTLHSQFIDLLIQRNFTTGSMMEEYYFSQCLKRVLRIGSDSHVDLRNPNFFASDYLVVDHDGRLYPTDEARMLSRVGQIDLCIGHVSTGVDAVTVQTLNSAALNNFDPDCIHCVYQPFCGTDVVDDLSRYGSVGIRRADTWFCGRHMSIFDKVFEVLNRDDTASCASVAHWLGIAYWSPGMMASYK